MRLFLVLLVFAAVGCSGAAPSPEPAENSGGDTVLVANRAGEALVVRALSAASVAAGYDFGEAVPEGAPTRVPDGEERAVPIARFLEGTGGGVVIGLFRPDGSGDAILVGRVESPSPGVRVGIPASALGQ